MQYAFSSVTVIAGKFSTLAGYEYSPVNNTNSRSFLYFAEPRPTGVRHSHGANNG